MGNNRIIKRKLFSLLYGLYLSLTFHISLHFPPLVSTAPLATVDALPQNAIAVFLNHLRIAFEAGYGLEQSLMAILIAVFMYHIYERLKENAYIHSIPLMLLSVLFGCMNVAGLCMYWLDSLPMFFSALWLVGSVMLAVGWGSLFFIFACLLFQFFDKGEILRRNSHPVLSGKYAWLYDPSNHHPWFSTWVLAICYELGVKFGSENLGIFISCV